MPLASLFSLQFYGPATAAMVASGVGEVGNAAPVQSVRGALNVPGAGDAPLLRPYRMRDVAVTADGAGIAHLVRPVRSVRAGVTVTIGELSQDDVTGAVLTAPVEGSLTLRDAIRILLAVQVGKTTVAGSTATFRDTADTKDRVIGTVVGGERTSVTLDPS